MELLGEEEGTDHNLKYGKITIKI